MGVLPVIRPATVKVLSIKVLSADGFESKEDIVDPRERFKPEGLSRKVGLFGAQARSILRDKLKSMSDHAVPHNNLRN